MKSNLSSLMEEFVKNGPSGCACSVTRDGKTLFRDFKGVRDIGQNLPVDENTVFRLFSMTKVIVCTAAMTLYEQGRFLLHEPLYEYIPSFRDTAFYKRTDSGRIEIERAKNPIRIEDIFSMSCGIPYGNDASLTGRDVKAMREMLGNNGPYTLADYVEELSRIPVDFEPGTHWVYGHGHELVARLIEVVSGMTVGEYLKKTIFEPLGMDHTGYRWFGNIRENMCVAYQRSEDGSMTPMPASRDANHEPDAVFEGGGSGLFSTLDDYAAFASMLACGGSASGERIIGRKTIDLMRSNRLDPVRLSEFRNHYLAGYGYGLGVRTMMEPAMGGANTSVGEFGWTGALGTYVSIDPSERAAVVYMHQMMPNMEEYHHLRIRGAAYALID